LHYSKANATRTASVLKTDSMFLRNVGTICQTARYHKKVTVCILFKDKLINISEGFLACVKSLLVIKQLAVKLQYAFCVRFSLSVLRYQQQLELEGAIALN
jgi:hypothetical protein